MENQSPAAPVSTEQDNPQRITAEENMVEKDFAKGMPNEVVIITFYLIPSILNMKMVKH